MWLRLWSRLRQHRACRQANLRLFSCAGVTAGALLVAGLATAGGGQSNAAEGTYPDLTDAEATEVRAALQAMKSLPRGPYSRILWFCNDGSRVLPREGNCQGRGGGRQHAELTNAAMRLGELGFHPGTILRALDVGEFVDAGRTHYRLRELVVEQYLVETDDGWVLRRARYYRGARQIEDEEASGREFLVELLADHEWLRANPLLATLLVRVVPHGQPGVPGRRIRQLAERMAELDSRLQDLRVKIHSRPGPADLDALRAFQRDREGQPPNRQDELDRVLAELSTELQALYGEAFDAPRWSALVSALGTLPLAQRMATIGDRLAAGDDAGGVIGGISGLLRDARSSLDGSTGAGLSGRQALATLDAMGYADALLKAAAHRWNATHLRSPDSPQLLPAGAPAPTRRELLVVLYRLIDAAYGQGWLSADEHHALTAERIDDRPRVTAASYRGDLQYAGSAADWSAASAHQAFGPVLDRYRLVEPAVARFEDNLLRDSVLLPFANILEVLSRDADRVAGVSHSVFSLDLPGRIVGLNPGLAVGTLRVLRDPLHAGTLDADGIYIVPETYAELGRVAGILTLHEGSRLSHVQLLARSLGIPNAVIPPRAADALEAFAGREVFYAVSNLGTVVLKLRENMDPRDVAIVEEGATVSEERIDLDEGKLDLGLRRLLPLDEVDLGDSGRIVGPKAANLGRLRRQFPGRVANGLVIPFGVFRQHIDRDLLGTGNTLYEDLGILYDEAERMRASGHGHQEVLSWTLPRLREVREAIAHMSFLPAFERELRGALRETFGPDGTYGVFVRSDTNVEDLPNFTGAGLNLTVMNQISEHDVLRAVRSVWASPFSERSYTWRQQLVDNPQQVYPSVVLLASVPVEASGVAVTKDLRGERPDVWTVTLAQGIGGVVDGESAETLLLPAVDGPPVLLSSARAIWQKALLMTGAGGVARVPATGGTSRLLNDRRAADLRWVIGEIIERYEPVFDEGGLPVPWDIEFGFLADDTQLFQIRPLVTNRKVRTLQALAALDQALRGGDYGPIDLDQPPETP